MSDPRKRRDYYAEEVDFLTSLGETPARILTALGLTAANLERALYREGRHDIARKFSVLAHEARRGTCDDCGGHTHEKRARRCSPCAKQARRLGLINTRPNQQRNAA